MKRTRWPGLVAVTLAVSLGSWWHAPEVRGQAAQPEVPDWLQQGLARETEDRGEKRTVSLLDDTLVTTVASRSQIEPEKTEWGTYFSMDIGLEGVPVECYVFYEHSGLAKQLNIAANELMQSVAEHNNSTLDAKDIVSFSIDRVGAHPYMLAVWFFSMQSEDGEGIAGFVKVATALVDQAMIYCLHSEPGYVETFRQVFVDILSEARPTREDTVAFFSELYFMEVNQRRLGYSQRRYALNDDGNVEIRTTTATAVVTARASEMGDATLMTGDDVTIELANTDGSLRGATAIAHQNDRLVLNLRLIQAVSGGWEVDGEFDGKPYNIGFGPETELVSRLGLVQPIRDVTRSTKRQSHSLITWLPFPDPSKPMKAVFSQAGNEPEGTLTLGPAQMAVTLADDGMLQEISADYGGGMRYERVWSNGALPQTVQ